MKILSDVLNMACLRWEALVLALTGWWCCWRGKPRSGTWSFFQRCDQNSDKNTSVRWTGFFKTWRADPGRGSVIRNRRSLDASLCKSWGGKINPHQRIRPLLVQVPRQVVEKGRNFRESSNSGRFALHAKVNSHGKTYCLIYFLEDYNLTSKRAIY